MNNEGRGGEERTTRGERGGRRTTRGSGGADALPGVWDRVAPPQQTTALMRCCWGLLWAGGAVALQLGGGERGLSVGYVVCRVAAGRASAPPDPLAAGGSRGCCGRRLLAGAGGGRGLSLGYVVCRVAAGRASAPPDPLAAIGSRGCCGAAPPGSHRRRGAAPSHGRRARCGQPSAWRGRRITRGGERGKKNNEGVRGSGRSPGSGG